VDDKKLDELLNSDAPNKPEKIPGGKSIPLTRTRISTQEQRKRREVLSRLLIQGTSNDMIFEIMGKTKNEDGTNGFGMSEAAVRGLIKEVYADWSDQDSERKPYNKTMAVRRIQWEMREAIKDNSWTSVAMLEKTLMSIQGTAEPLEIHATQEMRISNAVLNVLGEKDTKGLKALVESERKALAEEGRNKPIAVLLDGNEVYDKENG
jgi:hypothetical protein